jgi:hypothetical protein
MSAAGFEPVIPVSEQPQTHALDRAATWIGLSNSKAKLNGIMPLSEYSSGPYKSTVKIHVKGHLINENETKILTQKVSFNIYFRLVT